MTSSRPTAPPSTGPSDRRTPQSGYSLNELLVALAIGAVLVSASALAVTDSLRTYQRNAVARHVLSEIRFAQSQAVMRGAVFGLQWGADSGVNLPASQYRIVRDTSGSCTLPVVGAPMDGTNVIRSWRDLDAEYSGVSIESIRDKNNTDLGGVMFDSMGTAVNTCATAAFPVVVTVSDASGTTRRIEIHRNGGVRLL